MAIACEGYFCEQKKPRAPLREIDPEQLPAPRAWRCLWWLDPERKRELGRLVYDGVTVAHEVIKQSKEPDVAVRQLATDILYAWTLWVCWSLRCISWKPLSGSLGHSRALTGRKKTEWPELWENCGKLWETF